MKNTYSPSFSFGRCVQYHKLASASCRAAVPYSASDSSLSEMPLESVKCSYIEGAAKTFQIFISHYKCLFTVLTLKVYKTEVIFP